MQRKRIPFRNEEEYEKQLKLKRDTFYSILRGSPIPSEYYADIIIYHTLGKEYGYTPDQIDNMSYELVDALMGLNAEIGIYHEDMMKKK